LDAERGEGFKNVQGLLYSNTSACSAQTSLTHWQTNTFKVTRTKNTQEDRLYEKVKEHSHPAGCSPSVLLLMLTQTRLAFEAAFRYDIFTNIPYSFCRTFTCHERLSQATLGSQPSLVLYVSDILQSFGGSLEEMSSTFSLLKRKNRAFSFKLGASLIRPDGSTVLASLASCAFYTLCCLLI